MASSTPGGSGLLRGARTRSYGSLVQSPYSPAAIRKVEHLVEPGDTLQGLALKYGVTTEQIKRANRLYTNDSIFLKKYLSIPVPAEPSNGEGEGPESGERRPVTGEEEKSRIRRSASQAERRDEVTPGDYMTKLDTRIRVSKRAAVKKIRQGEIIAAEEDTVPSVGYQSPSLSRSREGSPQTQQRSLLGPVPLTVTSRTSALRDREDEIFKL